MRNEAQAPAPINPPNAVMCPSCGAYLPPPKKRQSSPLVGYHHCRECGLVFREPTE